MKAVYKFVAPLFVLVLLAVSVVGVAFAREADRSDGSQDETEIFGTVEAISGSAWTIDGKAYAVTAGTEIKGMIQPGARVKVHLTQNASGALVIREVELAAATGLSEDDSADDQSQGSDDINDDRHQNRGEDSDHAGLDDSRHASAEDSDRDGSDDSGQDSSDDQSDQDEDDSDEDHSGDDDEDEHGDDNHGNDDHDDDNSDDD